MDDKPPERLRVICDWLLQPEDANFLRALIERQQNQINDAESVIERQGQEMELLAAENVRQREAFDQYANNTIWIEYGWDSSEGRMAFWTHRIGGASPIGPFATRMESMLALLEAKP